MRIVTARHTVMLACAALGGGVTLSGGTARADGLDVSPSVVRPGQSITVSGGCQPTDRHVNITGSARGRGVVNDGWFSVSATPTKDRAGRYSIIAKCLTSNHSQNGAFQIRARHPDRDEGHRPHGGAMTGGGGTQEPDVPWTGFGFMLLIGATAVGAISLLRTRTTRRRA
ncbi:hypothetical protein [Actinomadura oligospora]|uniref:hypothetical protein n=1 Tax=Actinomadura oligospora TaxID=111804 RepID=UPI0004795313|nr:hypothetical protein [Actinomadura oligospora]